MAGSGGAVEFGFEGSLELARQLWALADDLVTEDGGRNGEYETAKAKFEGPHADSFAERRDTERSSRSNVVAGLREDARAWAEAWAKAMLQQNKNNRVDAVEQASEDRGWLEKGWDATFGSDDSDSEVAQAEQPPTPTPPSFTATATFQVF